MSNDAPGLNPQMFCIYLIKTRGYLLYYKTKHMQTANVNS